MTDGLIVQIVITALGFAYLVTKLRKIEDLLGMVVSIQVGEIITEKIDDNTIAVQMKKKENDDG